MKNCHPHLFLNGDPETLIAPTEDDGVDRAYGGKVDEGRRLGGGDEEGGPARSLETRRLHRERRLDASDEEGGGDEP